MISKHSFQLVKNLFRNLYFLMFLNGFLLASMFYFRMESTYEKGLFASIKGSIDSKLDTNDTQDSIIVKAMATCHDLMSTGPRYSAAPSCSDQAPTSSTAPPST